MTVELVSAQLAQGTFVVIRFTDIWTTKYTHNDSHSMSLKSQNQLNYECIINSTINIHIHTLIHTLHCMN